MRLFHLYRIKPRNFHQLFWPLKHNRNRQKLSIQLHTVKDWATFEKRCNSPSWIRVFLFERIKTDTEVLFWVIKNAKYFWLDRCPFDVCFSSLHIKWLLKCDLFCLNKTTKISHFFFKKRQHSILSGSKKPYE